MLSDLKKISKDLLIYSALVSEFEPLDFKNDALAGVRANYFNSRNLPQTEKTELTIDGKPLSLSYSMKGGEPLSWKAIYNNQPYQTVKRESGDVYCVISYNADGVVVKRQYYDIFHLWLRTEYYSADTGNVLRAVLSPKFKNSLVLLKYKEYDDKGTKATRLLFPSTSAPRNKSAALVYSNSGMIWYDESFRPDDFCEEKPAAKGGFDFQHEDFSSDVFSGMSRLIDEAPYLTEKDIRSETADEEKHTEPVAEENDSYSAYDKIERILFEAQKTNKNLFGELANQTKGEKSSKAEQEEPVSNATDHGPLSENEQDADEAALEMVEAFGKNPEASVFPSAQFDNTENTSFIPAQESEPDRIINAKSGEYRYYGVLDDKNRRSGKGRTVSDKGVTLYEGDYKEDKRHGFGVCYYKDGSVNYVGSWDNGSREGAGVGYRLSDGTMHAGSWSSNTPHGFGARFDKNGNFLDVCTYVNGKRSGKSVSFDKDGNLVVRVWLDGEMISEKIIVD